MASTSAEATDHEVSSNSSGKEPPMSLSQRFRDACCHVLQIICLYIVDFLRYPCYMCGLTCRRWRMKCQKHGADGDRQPLLQRKLMEDDIRSRLVVHFMGPLQKCQSRQGRSFPMKLILHCITVGLVTSQIILFGGTRTAVSEFIQSNKDALNSLFLDYGCEDSVMVYSMDDLYHQVQRVADTYYNIHYIGVAPYDYVEDENATDPDEPPLLHVSVVQYAYWKFDASSHDIRLSDDTHTFDIILHCGKNKTSHHPYNCSVQAQLEPRVNFSSIGSIQKLSVHFQLTSFYIDQQEGHYISCVTFDIVILFDNTAVSGTIPVTLTAHSAISDCSANQTKDQFYSEVFQKYVTLDIGVLVIIITYSIMCVLSIYFDFQLTWDTCRFFKHHYSILLSWQDIKLLQNFWLYGVLIGNVLVIIGTVLKLLIAYKILLSLNSEDITTLFLGLGVFCQWCGLLRFLSYFANFNILLVTLRISCPSVFRFIICAGILYLAFIFLGWLVLGPYHTKFTSFLVTSECLFSLLNGDDVYTTYKEMSQTSEIVWYFGKLYIYLFTVLFTIVVLNVFIGLIDDTYRTLHAEWGNQAKGFLRDFADQGMAQCKRKKKTTFGQQTHLTTVEGEEGLVISMDTGQGNNTGGAPRHRSVNDDDLPDPSGGHNVEVDIHSNPHEEELGDMSIHERMLNYI